VTSGPWTRSGADIFLDLLNGHADLKANGGGVVDIKVDLTTLTELDDNPAEIPGWGPVIAEVARDIASRADLQTQVTGADRPRHSDNESRPAM
jgi:hypothetical protein